MRTAASNLLASTTNVPMTNWGLRRDTLGSLVAFRHSTPTFNSSTARLGRPAASRRSLPRYISMKLRDGWTLQPNFQYITHPGGGATDPLGSNPGKVLKDAAVFGLRTVLKF